MFRQAHHSERVPIPTSALVCTTKPQLNKILQAFVQRKRLFQYHEKLHGVVVNVQVDCFNPTTPCTHTRHVWPMTANCSFVHVPCTYHCMVLSLKPGDRVPCTVKQVDPRGLLCTAKNSETSNSPDLDFIVFKDAAIPDLLWLPGTFLMLVFEGVSSTDGPYGVVAPEFVAKQPTVEAPGLMLSDARELLFELDAMMASSSAGPGPKSTKTTRKSKKTALSTNGLG
jgi:hypothetical protein